MPQRQYSRRQIATSHSNGDVVARCPGSPMRFAAASPAEMTICSGTVLRQRDVLKHAFGGVDGMHRTGDRPANNEVVGTCTQCVFRRGDALLVACISAGQSNSGRDD